MFKYLALLMVTAGMAATPILAQTSTPPVDFDMLHDIKAQAFYHSQAMDTLFNISDVYGPRITASPNHRAAAEWVMKRLESYGLKNVHLEAWPFGNSWQFQKFYGALLQPDYAPLIGFPLAWTPGTDGPVTAVAVFAPINGEADFAKYHGKLRGKIVLIADPKALSSRTEPYVHRLTREEIEERTIVSDPAHIDPLPGMFRPLDAPQTPQSQIRATATRNRIALNNFLHDEGPAVVVEYGMGGDDGTVFGAAGGAPDPKEPVPPPMVAIALEQYNRVVRLIQNGIAPKLTFDIQATFYKDQDGFNVIGEIPGTTKPQEIVMLGGHFDSWQGGTGATDNGAGASVAIEAMRVLASLHKPMARTVRVALWGGEEQGLLGSRAYVEQHFADRATMKLKPEYAKFDVYFNDDQGGGKFRAISAYGSDQAAVIFRNWIAPLRDLGIEDVTGATAAPTGDPAGTDHTDFLWVGLPGVGFMQDPLDYATRTHHSNMDLYDHVQPGDIMQSVAVEAWLAYNSATLPEMLPRIQTPAPLPEPK